MSTMSRKRQFSSSFPPDVDMFASNQCNSSEQEKKKQQQQQQKQDAERQIEWQKQAGGQPDIMKCTQKNMH